MSAMLSLNLILVNLNLTMISLIMNLFLSYFAVITEYIYIYFFLAFSYILESDLFVLNKLFVYDEKARLASQNLLFLETLSIKENYFEEQKK